jgi:ADP-ribose pyrophosphatase
MAESKVLKQEIVFNGGHVKVRVDRVIEPAGHEATREIVVHSGAVCIVAKPSDTEVLLVRQYRHATGGELLEIPAGGLDPGEDPLDAARRELEEETGYRAANIVQRAAFWTTPGFTTEYMWLYEATNLTRTQINPDEDEVIEVDVVKVEDALRMIDDGRIQDAKTILGLLRVFGKS